MSAPSTQRIVLRERRAGAMMMAIYTVLTFGLVWVLVVLARLLHDPLQVVDEGGVTTRDGKRFTWASLSDAKTVVEHMRTANPSRLRETARRLELTFGDRRLAFDARTYENGAEALALIEREISRVLRRGPT